MIYKSEDDIKLLQEKVDLIKEEASQGDINSVRLTNILDSILDNVKETYEYMEAKSEALEKAVVEYEGANYDAHEAVGYDYEDEVKDYMEKVEEVVENIKNNEYDVDELREIKNDVNDFIENSPDTLVEKIKDAVQDKINELEDVIVNSDDVETILEVSKDILDLETITEGIKYIDYEGNPAKSDLSVFDVGYNRGSFGKEDLKEMLADIENGEIIYVIEDDQGGCYHLSREPFEIKGDNVTKDEDDGDDSPTYEGEDGVDDKGDDDGSGSVDNEGDW